MRYRKEVKDFITANVSGRTTKDLVVLVNEAFGTDFTESKMKSYKANYGLKSGTPGGLSPGRPSKVFPKEVQTYIQKNYSGTGYKDMAELLNKTFGTGYTTDQIKSYYGNHHFNSGLKGYFQKGHVPINKGLKGYHSPGSEKGWFGKGHMPTNYVPVGSESITTDGYPVVKIADPNKWRPKHIQIWEAVNGPVPKGHALLFGDGNKLNSQLDNLILVTRAQLATWNLLKISRGHVDTTKTGLMLVDVLQKASKRRQSMKKRKVGARA